MKHHIGTADVERVAEAKTGSKVWVFDSQASLHDESDKYIGRGVWTLREVTGETKQSLLCSGLKFDRKTGSQRDLRGWSAIYIMAGEKDKEDWLWSDRHRHRFIEHMRSIDTAELRRIADLLGWKP